MIKLEKKDYPKFIKDNITYNKLIISKIEEDRLLAEMYVRKKILVPICEQTLKVLNFCTPYYEYVGIRTSTPVNYHDTWGTSFSIFGQPFGIKEKEDWETAAREGRGDCNRWPAIWKAVELAGLPGSCGNHHQYQINKALTTGLYKNKNEIWYKV